MSRTRRRTEDEEEFDRHFDQHGRLRPGVTHVKVPVSLMDSADYFIRVDPDVRLDGATPHRSVHTPGFVDGKSKKKQADPDEDNDEEGSGADTQDCYSTYDATVSSAWRDGNEPL